MEKKNVHGAVRYFQFRLDADLFDSILTEVERRKKRGEKTSINQVGQEWMTKGRDADHNRLRD